ncbi:MAG: hypothetical protein WCF57_20655 [Pyrinomonadaceae bacterium]
MIGRTRRITALVSLLALVLLSPSRLVQLSVYAQVPPCHPNPRAAQDKFTVRNRGDVVHLPQPLKDRLQEMAGRPHTFLPMQAFAEADDPSQLFQYYLLDTNGFEPNVFTAKIPGINDTAILTATGGNCGLPTIGSVRLVLEPKPGLPTDPGDPGAFIDVFTDLAGLFVINNESGWYEGWMIHDLRVATVAAPRPGGQAQFGHITSADAMRLQQMGAHNNTPGHIFTMDGNTPRFPSATDHFPDIQTNVVPLQLSMGAYNSMQQTDVHAYWEFNYTTNWIHPLYELPFTGGMPGSFEAGRVGRVRSIVPGSGPSGVQNDPRTHGDNPNNPRDPDRMEAEDEDQTEFRMRFIPSGLAREVYLDVYERLASFEPSVTNFGQRLFDAYAQEVARVDEDHDGVISAEEGDIEGMSDGMSNERLFIPATEYNRFAVTREINDGLLAPRFAPSQRAWVQKGFQVLVNPTVDASTGRDGDDR